MSQSNFGNLVGFYLGSYDALFIYFIGGSTPDEDDCMYTCSGIGGPGFRGYTFFRNSKRFKDSKADCACHYDDGHAPDCPSADDLIGFPVERKFRCAKSEAGAASGPISRTVSISYLFWIYVFGPAQCFAVDSYVDPYGGKSAKSKGEYHPSSRSGLRSLISHRSSSR